MPVLKDAVGSVPRLSFIFCKPLPGEKSPGFGFPEAGGLK
ncbi:hypothetical protein M068_2349 [Bacteroides fragilis str. J38-1]|nr:hypothetical protein M068_2349 [Bacteroides fragilis str. J38-1]DAT22102.1 MAG TPA: hypothetical protein [Caudoviricetes sp.]